MPRIKCVVFDIGETIVCEDRQWAEWAEWLGVRPSVMFTVLGALIAEGKDHRFAFEILHPGFDFERERQAKEAAGLSWKLAAEDLYPDAVPCLRTLSERGFRLGLAGNQPASIESMVDDLKLPVDFVASSDRWGVEKPSPQFFARVIEECHADSSEIAYVGDRIDNDVLPAKRAGMFAAFIRRGPWGIVHATWREVVQADAVVQSLVEIPAIVAFE